MRFEWDSKKNRINQAKDDTSIRIISAPEADQRERRIYIKQASQ
jgi:uncharacterized DUF497 family protein